MNLLSILENGLFALGQVLRFPVMALLWVCVAASLYMSGQSHRFCDAAPRAAQLQSRYVAPQRIGASHERRPSAFATALPRRLLSDVEKAREDDTLSHGGLEHHVLEYEERVRHSLNGPRMLVKVGPALGLLGTLIPMGTSLASLAAGNLEAMAGQMVVAFTTTIVGRATGTLAYVISAIRLKWVNESVREQRYLAERIAGELTRDPVMAKEL